MAKLEQRRAFEIGKEKERKEEVEEEDEEKVTAIALSLNAVLFPPFSMSWTFLSVGIITATLFSSLSGYRFSNYQNFWLYFQATNFILLTCCALPNKMGDERSIWQENMVRSTQPDQNLLALMEKCMRYTPLVKAVIQGDWESTKRFLDQNEEALTGGINEFSETALHIAVGTGKPIHFVEKLVELMPEEALARTASGGETALHTAAWAGNTKAAVILVQKHRPLLYIRDRTNSLPIHMAAGNARKETLSYLLTVTEDDPVSMPFSNQSGGRLITYVITSEFYDIALNLVRRYPQLATLETGHHGGAFERIATKVSAFRSGSHLNFWQHIIYSCVPLQLENCLKDHKRSDIENPVNISQVIARNKVSKKLHAAIWKALILSVPQIKQIQEQKLMHFQALELVKCLCEVIRSSNDINAHDKQASQAVTKAARFGIHEIVEEIVGLFPPLFWDTDSENRNILQRAVIERHENVFNLIYQIGDYTNGGRSVIGGSRETILHLAGQLAPSSKLNRVPGAALQMQRELQWYKEVEKFVNPSLRDWQNNKKETPAMVFTKQHENLVVAGEKWMKETSSSCTIAATLIATVVFAAAITVPGGSDDKYGLPIFSRDTAFIIFAVSDAISLFTSTTSLLMFLSILTARYSEGDFLYALPKRLIIGLVALFLSVTTMMIAFSATLYLVFGHNKAWTLLPVVALAGLPITSFVFLQFPLLVDLISSTYGPGIFGKKSDRILY